MYVHAGGGLQIGEVFPSASSLFQSLSQHSNQRPSRVVSCVPPYDAFGGIASGGQNPVARPDSQSTAAGGGRGMRTPPCLHMCLGTATQTLHWCTVCADVREYRRTRMRVQRYMCKQESSLDSGLALREPAHRRSNATAQDWPGQPIPDAQTGNCHGGRYGIASAAGLGCTEKSCARVQVRSTITESSVLHAAATACPPQAQRAKRLRSLELALGHAVV